MSETALVAGIGQLLATAGVGVWSETTAYIDSQVGIYRHSIPETAVEGVALGVYPVDDDDEFGDSTLGLQVRFRSASPSLLGNRASAAFSALQNLHGVDLNGVHVTQCSRRSGADMPQPAPGQPLERTENYYLTVHLPTLNRL